MPRPIALVLALLALPALLGGCAAGRDASPPSPPDDLPPALAAAAAALHWAVEDAAGTVLGSATLIAPGLLLTNRHVIGDVAELRVRQAPGEALTVARSLVATGEDCALLAVPGAPGFAVHGAPATEAGRVIVASGMLAGQRRVTMGSTAEPVPAAQRRARAWLPVAPGFSGGPVLDAEGQLIGLIVAAVAETPEAARRLSALGAAGQPLPPEPRLVLYLPIAGALASLVSGR